MALIVQLRLAQYRDWSAIQSVAQAAYQPYVARMGRRPAPMDCNYGVLIDQKAVWVIDDPVTAFIVAFLGDDRLLIETVAVAPEHQGQGIGSDLIAAVEEKARLAGIGRSELYTNVLMTENLRYYPRLGYQETHRAEQDGFSRVFFQKDLSA